MDHGNTEKIATTDIYQIHNSCIPYPKQAVRCSLRGIYPLVGSEWDDDAISRFHELVSKKQLTGNIINVSWLLLPLSHWQHSFYLL